MRIGVDLDGVVANFTKGWTELYEKEFGKKILEEEITEWSKMGKTIFIISHDKKWLEKNCDTIFKLENSELYQND